MRRLTLDQLDYVYGHETDKEGNLVPMFFAEGEKPPTEKERAIAGLRLRGLSEENAEAVYADRREEREYKTKLDAEWQREIEAACQRYADELQPQAGKAEEKSARVQRRREELWDAKVEQLNRLLYEFRAEQAKKRKLSPW